MCTNVSALAAAQGSSVRGDGSQESGAGDQGPEYYMNMYIYINIYIYIFIYIYRKSDV